MGRSSSTDESHDAARSRPLPPHLLPSGPAARGATRPHRIAPEQFAWVAAAPAALLTIGAILVLGPVIGRLLFPAASDSLWPAEWWEAEGSRDPAKHARYLLAVIAPLLLAAAVLWGARRTWTLSERLVRALVLGSQLLVVAIVAAALMHEHVVLTPVEPLPPIFGIGSVVAAAGIAVAALAAARSEGVARRIAALARETKGRHAAALAIVVCFLAIWLLKVPLVDGPVEETSNYNLTWTLNDAFAVLNGRTPLVDYHPIYAKLLPYPSALVLSVFGKTTLVYTLLMAVLDALALLAVYGIFRRLARSSLYALALFLPFVAVSDITRLDTWFGTVSPMSLTAMWPMRYGGAFLIAWMTARRLERPTSRHLWLLFFVGGLVAIDSLEFGMGALAATVVALLAAQPDDWRRNGMRLAASAAAGLLAAAATVCLFTLVRAGALPNPAIFLEWPRIFTNLGWFSLPLPTVGLHLAIYVTFAAAIVTGAVRIARRDDDVLLTGMLLWSGVFGLAAGGYVVARPDVYKLTAMLSAWSFALTPLVIVCLRALPATRGRRPQLAHLLVLFGFALSVTTLTRLSPPQEQIEHFTDDRQIPTYRPLVEEFVRTHTRPGETVAILVPMGFRIADELGLRNVSPYPLENAIVTQRQMNHLLVALRRHDVGKVFMPMPGEPLLATEGEAPPAHVQVLMSQGYVRGPSARDVTVMELTRG